MSYWQVLLILGGVAALFILWPLIGFWRRQDGRESARVRAAANAELYQEHLAELEQQLADGDITEDEFKVLQREQQRALLEDVGDQQETTERRSGAALLIVFAVLVPVLGWITYEQLGARDDWRIRQAVKQWQSGAQTEEFETELRHQLSRRLEERPANTHNWYLLASLAMNVQDYDQAVSAFRRIVELEPDSPQILAELAQALFLQAGNRVTPEVRRYTQHALELQPDMPTALGLAGIDAFQQGYFKRAIRHWTRAVDLLGQNAPGAQALLSGIARAQAELEEGGAVAEVEPADGPSLNVTVRLGEGVEVDPDATVFVYARAHQGPRMPLAIQRFAASELPRQVQLDDSMSMAPGMVMSQFERLELVARISSSGDAVPKSGDWQVTAGPISLADDNNDVTLIIEQRIP